MYKLRGAQPGPVSPGKLRLGGGAGPGSADFRLRALLPEPRCPLAAGPEGGRRTGSPRRGDPSPHAGGSAGGGGALTRASASGWPGRSRHRAPRPRGRHSPATPATPGLRGRRTGGAPPAGGGGGRAGAFGAGLPAGAGGVCAVPQPNTGVTATELYPSQGEG